MKNVTIQFSQEQINVLNHALVELPYRIAFPLITHINAEIQRNFDKHRDDSEVQTVKSAEKLVSQQ